MSNQHEMLLQLTNDVREIADRSRRTETNLHKIREHLGVAGPKDQVVCIDHNVVKVHGLDVTLAQILKCLEGQPDFEGTDTVQVRSGNTMIAVLTFMV